MHFICSFGLHLHTETTLRFKIACLRENLSVCVYHKPQHYPVLNAAQQLKQWPTYEQGLMGTQL